MIGTVLPEHVALYQGTALAVQSHDILYRLSLDILYTLDFWRVEGRRWRGGRWRFRISEFGL